MATSFDALILGSGFPGTILGWILASRGWHVLIVDPASHPRMAIGESSTPVADRLLGALADRYGLTRLGPLASWGTWKAAYPDVVCGKKRGFSYYRHHPGLPFQDDACHRASYLVAANSDDQHADTHWLRSSVDQFLAAEAVAAGVQLDEGTIVGRARYASHERLWRVDMKSPDGETKVEARWLIDASGGAAASARWTGNRRDDDWMRTRTTALFGHFVGVAPFDNTVCPDAGLAGDDAAQHHLLDDGWLWILRMDNGVTSVGRVTPGNHDAHPGPGRQAIDHLIEPLSDYPSLAAMLASARVVDVAGRPAQTVTASGRISRCHGKASGPGWLMLPSTFGLVDPLHSTGIAHSLSGVWRAAELLLGPEVEVPRRLRRYQAQLRRETGWIDTLVSGCYRALPSWQRFVAYSSFYFAATIAFERLLRRDPTDWPQGFLSAGDAALVAAAEQVWTLLDGHHVGDRQLVEMVRRLLGPWNDVGLLDPNHCNRLRHSATK